MRCPCCYAEPGPCHWCDDDGLIDGDLCLHCEGEGVLLYEVPPHCPLCGRDTDSTDESPLPEQYWDGTVALITSVIAHKVLPAYQVGRVLDDLRVVTKCGTIVALEQFSIRSAPLITWEQIAAIAKAPKPWEHPDQLRLFKEGAR